MTLDEAIKHAEEVANANERLCETVHPSMQLSDYGKCAKEHRQLVGWLKELKRYREANTVCIDGILYQSKHPTLKTIHGKTGEVVIGGFKEVKSRCRKLQ